MPADWIAEQLDFMLSWERRGWCQGCSGQIGISGAKALCRPLCRFLDAGMPTLSARSCVRRPAARRSNRMAVDGDDGAAERTEIDPELRRRRTVDQPQPHATARFGADDLRIGE